MKLEGFCVSSMSSPVCKTKPPGFAEARRQFPRVVAQHGDRLVQMKLLLPRSNAQVHRKARLYPASAWLSLGTVRQQSIAFRKVVFRSVAFSLFLLHGGQLAVLFLLARRHRASCVAAVFRGTPAQSKIFELYPLSFPSLCSAS